MAQNLPAPMPPVVMETLLDWTFGKSSTDRCYLHGTKVEPHKFITKNAWIGLTRIRASQFPHKLGTVELRFKCTRAFCQEREKFLNDLIAVLGVSDRVQHSETNISRWILTVTIPNSTGMDYLGFAKSAIGFVQEIQDLFVWHYTGGVLRAFCFPSPTMSIVPCVELKGNENIVSGSEYLNLGKYLDMR